MRADDHAAVSEASQSLMRRAFPAGVALDSSNWPTLGGRMRIVRNGHNDVVAPAGVPQIEENSFGPCAPSAGAGALEDEVVGQLLVEGGFAAGAWIDDELEAVAVGAIRHECVGLRSWQAVMKWPILEAKTVSN